MHFSHIFTFLHTNSIKNIITMLLITNIIQYFMPEKGKDDVKINDAVLVKSTKHILNFFYPGSVV